MKEAIRQRAVDLGFDDCRFTTAQPPESAAHFQTWLAAQHHGEMNWLERTAAKRANPQHVLNGAKSIVTLVVSYATGVREAEGVLKDRKSPTIDQNSGVVARYARYDDYHDVIGERLQVLTGFINQLGDTETRSLWYVDTGPLLERDFAQRAGLGFVGKHTNLISRKFGNWIFLSEILTTIELPPDEPEKNRCGKCTHCIKACPTNAITAPFRLDARRCISYLTIELKSSIPIEFRRAIGNRIYGCDDCLAVCPWNRFAREGQMMKQHSRQDLTAPDLVELLTLDEAAFKRRFANSPILRTKRRGFLRNVCVALGNVGGKEVLPALLRATHDPEPLIAEHAKWAVDEIEST